ncbi:MAG: TauD/TfdA family dioxygenase [Candidatus Rokubacteria bacterium]|nr:TauD/TfdA family dioxygenase [Candidatus Rokubacteria bacterium]
MTTPRTIGEITGPEVWRAEDLARTTDWIHRLSDVEIADLDTALRAVQRRNLPWREIRRADFPLTVFGTTLARVSNQLEHGRGLALLRGLPVARHGDDDLRRLYWGIGVHLGTPRFQNARGELIGEVRDEVRLYGAVQEETSAAGGEAAASRSSRAKARSSGPLRFHTDRCDVVALLCVRQARRGGLSRVVSTVTVSNTIRARRPDLHALLCQDYHRSRQGEETGGEGSVYALPIFGARSGKFTSQYSRTFVEAAQLLPRVPRISRAQDEALDMVAEVCEELCYTMELQPGDVQLLNNHVVYHGRTAYEDGDGADADRLLLRLWLATPNSRALPEGFEALWGSIEPGALRGGIEQARP